MNFIDREFQQLMLEIWKVKLRRIKRFGEVIRSTRGVKLDHYLNDADSPRHSTRNRRRLSKSNSRPGSRTGKKWCKNRLSPYS
jgi:hypothetical protein